MGAGGHRPTGDLCTGCSATVARRLLITSSQTTSGSPASATELPRVGLFTEINGT